MATKCFSQVKGRIIRVTRVNATGTPHYGVCSSLTTEGFVTVNITKEIQEGEETTVTTASGSICHSSKAKNQTKWYNVEMTFCLVDPDLVTLVNPMFAKLSDYQGNTNGFDESYDESDTEGIALEVWMESANVQNTDRFAQGSWIYRSFPYIVGGTMGDEEIGGSAINVIMRGRTRLPHNWGRGPYNDVELNPSPFPGGAPVPGPLLTPIPSNRPARRIVTYLKPPDPKCGCQPLSNPDGPTFTVNEVSTDANRMTVAVRAASAGSYEVDFGDGAPPVSLPAAGLTHTYVKPDTYPISVWSTVDPQKITIRLVSVPFVGALAPAVTLLEDTTDTLNRRSVIVTVDNHGNGPVIVNFGDGSPTVSNPGDNVAQSKHVYDRAGSVLVTVTDADDALAKNTTPLRVPFGQALPELTVANDPADPAGRSVKVTVNNHGNGPVVLGWGDNSQNSVNDGTGTTVSGHQFPAGNATYTITATDTDDATATASADWTVPHSVLTASAKESTNAPADPNRRKITLTWDNADQGPVKIWWGDEPAGNPGPGVDGAQAGNLDHTYTTSTTFHVKVADVELAARNRIVDVTVPFTGALAAEEGDSPAEPPPDDEAGTKTTRRK